MDSRSDYREILKSEYQQRRSRNANYSLRAFARDIGLSSPRLTDILKCRQGLSRKKAYEVAQKLNYGKTKSDFFCNAVESTDGRSKAGRENARQQILKYGFMSKRSLRLDQFKIISEWYHFAILSLTNVVGFDGKPAWIAKKLGIDTPTAKRAIERLLRLQLLNNKDNRLSETGNVTAFEDDIPNEWGQSFHRQILQKAIVAIEEQKPCERELTAMTLAIHPQKIKVAKKMIADFVKEFDKEMSLEQDLQKLYCLSIQFFSLEKD